MNDVNSLSCEQLVEVAVSNHLVYGIERKGEMYLVRLETEEMEFEEDVFTRFLRGMVRVWYQWLAFRPTPSHPISA